MGQRAQLNQSSLIPSLAKWKNYSLLDSSLQSYYVKYNFHAKTASTKDILCRVSFFFSFSLPNSLEKVTNFVTLFRGKLVEMR
jgi:hypothetical protein